MKNDCRHHSRPPQLTYEGELLGGPGLQLQTILQPQQVRVGDAVSMAVQAGGHAGLLGLRFWVDQDHRRDWWGLKNVITHSFMVDYTLPGAEQTHTHTRWAELGLTSAWFIFTHNKNPTALRLLYSGLRPR